MAARCSAVTFSSVDVAQQLELQDSAFFYLASTSMCFGRARERGMSSRTMRVAERHRWAQFASTQNLYNLLYREEEREMVPQCVDQGVRVLPYSPLARGLLAGTRTREGERRTTRSRSDPPQGQLYGRAADFAVIERASSIARARGTPAAQVALAWLLHKRGVTAPIIGATKAAHVDDALAAVDVSLSPDEVGRLEERYVPHPA